MIDPDKILEWGIPIAIAATGWIIKQGWSINRKIEHQGMVTGKKLDKVGRRVATIDKKKVSHTVCKERMAACQCLIQNVKGKKK